MLDRHIEEYICITSCPCYLLVSQRLRLLTLTYYYFILFYLISLSPYLVAILKSRIIAFGFPNWTTVIRLMWTLSVIICWLLRLQLKIPCIEICYVDAGWKAWTLLQNALVWQHFQSQKNTTSEVCIPFQSTYSKYNYLLLRCILNQTICI